MKRLIEKGLMFGNLIEVSSPALIERYNSALHCAVGFRTTPHPRPLPTWGRGGVGSLGWASASAVLSPPSPMWGGLGWGAVGPGDTL